MRTPPPSPAWSWRARARARAATPGGRAPHRHNRVPAAAPASRGEATTSEDEADARAVRSSRVGGGRGVARRGRPRLPQRAPTPETDTSYPRGRTRPRKTSARPSGNASAGSAARRPLAGRDVSYPRGRTRPRETVGGLLLVRRGRLRRRSATHRRRLL